MAGLTGKTIAATYHSILKVSTSDNQNLDTTLRDIVDGEDTASCLKLATDKATITLGTGGGDDFIIKRGSTEILKAEGDNGDLTLASPGVFKGYMPWIHQASFLDGGADTVFIPLGSTTSEDTTPSANSGSFRLCMPYVGYLEKIIFRTQSTADTVDFEIYKAPSGTDADDADQNKLSATVSIEDDIVAEAPP